MSESVLAFPLLPRLGSAGPAPRPEGHHFQNNVLRFPGQAAPKTEKPTLDIVLDEISGAWLAIFDAIFH